MPASLLPTSYSVNTSKGEGKIIVKILPTWSNEQKPSLCYLHVYPFPGDYFCLL